MLDITCDCNIENSTSVRLINISSVKTIQIIDKKKSHSLFKTYFLIAWILVTQLLVLILLLF